MGIKLGGMTLSSIFKKPETQLYPFEQKPLPAAHKGIVVLDPTNCILCGICAKQCPAHAIVVDKPARTWTVDRFRCVQCCTCTYGCPKNCLSMDPTRPVIGTKKEATVVAVPEQEKPAKKADDAAAEAAPAVTYNTGDPALDAKLAKMDPEKAKKFLAAMEAKKKKAEAAE